MMKLAKLLILLLLLSLKGISQTKNVLIIHTEPNEYISDVNNLKTKLFNTNKFNSVDIFDAQNGTPTLTNLLNYDAVLVTSNFSYADPVGLGNVIADYIDAGGGVVNSLYSENSPRELIVPGWGDNGINLDLSSRFYTKNYNLFSILPYTWGSPQNLGFKKNISSHPILNGVNTFSGGEASYTSVGIPTLTSGSSVIASWSNDWPLVIVNDDIGLSHVKRVDLNFYAIVISDGIDRSGDGWFNGGWDASSNGALLIANSLLYVSNGLVPTFANTGPVTLCLNGSYYLNPSTTDGTFSTTSPTIAIVNSSGYVTGVSEGSTTVSLMTGGGTVTATITVGSSSGLSITDPLAQSSYKFNNNPQGPVGGLNNYIGYNGYNYSSQARPINTGFFRASKQLGNEAGCPYDYYIFRCTTCGTVQEYATRPQGTLTGNTIQPGSTGQLTYASTNGGGPFTIVYLPSGGNNVTVTGKSSGQAIPLGTITSSKTYNLISVTDEISKATTDFSGTIATVSVVPSPTASLTGTQSICSGTTATLNLTATGTGSITVTLNNGTIINTVSGTTTISVTPTINTTYTISSVIDTYSSGTSTGSATVSIYAPASITVQQMSSATIIEGATTTLSVTATGQPTLSYQWYKDGVAINGANSNSYTTTNTTSAAGTYYVTVSTTCNVVSSTTSTVSVTARPQGTLTGNTILPGGSTGQLTYTSSNGAGPFTIVYQPSGGSNVTVNNISSTVAFNVASGTPSVTTTYTLVSVTDQNTTASRTSGFTGGTATITISSDYVTIGTQIWTNKNLDVTTYRNGDVIAQITNTTDWANATAGAWCYYNNDPANGAIYGKLYNWYAVNDPRGLAPQGWHIPTDAEWTTLGTLLGGDAAAGGKMKTTGTTRWTTPNTSATNESGFAGLPGGYRINDGPFGYVGRYGSWWSATEGSSADAWNRGLYYSDGNLYRGYDTKRYGFSVRCLRD